MVHIMNQAEKHQWFLEFDSIEEIFEEGQKDKLYFFDEAFVIDYIESNFDHYTAEINESGLFGCQGV